MIDNTPALARKVKPQASRSGRGSTTYSKKFGADTLTLAIATSTADLRSKTVKKAFLDEVDEYPDDLDGQGDLVDMVTARQESFLQTGEWKRASISTPDHQGLVAHLVEVREPATSGVGNARCPGCSEEFVFEFGPFFRHEAEFPYRAHYVAPCCGTVIEGCRRTAWCAAVAGSRHRPGRASTRAIISTRCPRRSCLGTSSPSAFSTPATIRRS